MSSGIVGKVWNISGENQKKSTKQNMSDSIEYVLNDEKTSQTLKMDPINQLERECKYVENDIKTQSGALVGGYNVMSTNVTEAVEEMMQVKKFFNKTGGRAALHLMISLPEEESDIKNAPRLMQLCNDVISELFPNNQAIYAIHTNTDNMHVHCIINTVGLDGKKIHQGIEYVKKEFQPCINKYAKKYGFTQNKKWKEANIHNEEYTYPQLKIKLREAVDKAIEEAETFDGFLDNVKSGDMDVRIGKHLSLKLPGMKKAIRTNSLGHNYTVESIAERIANKREKLEGVTMGNYAYGGTPDNVFETHYIGMKKYKDMSDEQKKDVIQKLKLGKNPWRENSRLNWQLNRLADEINTSNRVRTYIDYYSDDGTLQGALDGIVEAKKQVMHDKRMIAYAKQKYKPILDIYDEMKSIERKAYLYEHNLSTEYRSEFITYRSLTRRLKKNYNKDVLEVASFLKECDERTLYAHAQLSELSAEYREIRRYGIRKGEIKVEDNSLIGVMGYYANREREKNGLYEADAYYIASTNSDITVSVLKFASETKNGKTYEWYKIRLDDMHGNEIVELSNEGDDPDFVEKLKSIQSEYGLNDCKRFENYNDAKAFYANLAQKQQGKEQQGKEQQGKEQQRNIRK